MGVGCAVLHSNGVDAGDGRAASGTVVPTELQDVLMGLVHVADELLKETVGEPLLNGRRVQVQVLEAPGRANELWKGPSTRATEAVYMYVYSTKFYIYYIYKSSIGNR